MNALDVVRIEIDPNELVGATWNPNEMEKDEFDLLKEQIVEVGFIDPPTVAEVEGSDGAFFYRIIGGHNRVEAAKELKLSLIPVDVLQGERWKDEDLQKLQTVRLNVLHGKTNPEKMVALYNEMATKYGAAVTKMLGYTTDHGLKKMIKQVQGDLSKTLSPDLAKQFAEQAKEAKTLGDLEKIIQKLMAESGESAKYGFVVFSWGGKEHIYVAMSDKTREALKRIVRAARTKKVDINEIIEEAITDASRNLEF
jgi:DNA repair exonuclease SbcCD nuclease subunit